MYESSGFDELIEPKPPDDRSSHLHRQVVGWLGIVLPGVVWAVNWLRPTQGLTPDMLGSVSAYYYSSAVAFFVGIISVLALHLVTYGGYKNSKGWLDSFAKWVATIAAILVVAFPTAPPPKLTPSWWSPTVGDIHVWSAGFLFGAFAFFSLVLFPMSREKKERTGRERVRVSTYYICGVGMIGCLLWIGVGPKGEIFWPETFALWFFGISWLAKGRADKTAEALARRLFDRRPRAAIDGPAGE